MAQHDSDEQLVRAFRALGHPNRLAIYLTLLAQEKTELPHCSLSALIDRLDIGAPTVSHHTRELVNAGLIRVSRDGKYLHCTLNEAMRARLAAFFDPAKGEQHASKTGSLEGRA